jgi:hypothetical protein
MEISSERSLTMFFTDLLFAVVVALVISALLTGVMGWRLPGKRVSAAWLGSLIFLFLILFLASWAGGVWLRPFGPVLFGGYWLPFTIVGLVTALVLLTATVPPPRRRPSTPREVEVDEAVATMFNFFFWVLSLALVAVIVTAYVA